ncbi:MAG: hypothetical protein R3185_00315 [Candidatus Thermoplasmatota archaeon]|nr:hypothetical protein [Candidatus Thermoplasmatota archaeon]
MQAVEIRAESDIEPSFFTYAILPFLFILLGIGLIVVTLVTLVGTADPEGVDPSALGGVSAALMGVAAISILVGAAIPYVGFYKLISRRNDHLSRDRVLRQGLLDYCRARARSEEAEHALERMERIHNEAMLEENERPAVLHLVIGFLVGLWMLYVYYFLLKDFPRHSRRQARFLGHARAVLEPGEASQLPSVPPMQERPFWLVLLLMLIPVVNIVGAFVVLYWLYNDPPEHFRAQWAFEDALVARVQSGEDEPPAPGEGDEGPDAPPGEEKPAFTVWGCPECEKRYKVPPKRPVKVTCRNCGHQAILRE